MFRNVVVYEYWCDGLFVRTWRFCVPKKKKKHGGLSVVMKSMRMMQTYLRSSNLTARKEIPEQERWRWSWTGRWCYHESEWYPGHKALPRRFHFTIAGNVTPPFVKSHTEKPGQNTSGESLPRPVTTTIIKLLMYGCYPPLNLICLSSFGRHCYLNTHVPSSECTRWKS